MRLKDRLTLAFSGTVGAVLLTSFSLVYVLVERDEERDLDRVLRVQAGRVVGRIIESGVHDALPLHGTLALPEGPGVALVRAAVFKVDGAIEVATPSFVGGPPKPSSLALPATVPESGVTVEVMDDHVLLRGVVVPIYDRGARLLYAVPRKSIDDDLAFLSRTFVTLFLGALVVTHLVARWLAAHLVRDVDTLREVAQSVAEGKLSTRVGERALGSQETRDFGLALDHMIGQLEALVSAQSTFLSHAAHELRSPLATLRGELQLALRRPRNEAEYRDVLESLLRDVDQLSALAEDLLTLARIQGRTPGARGRVPVEELLDDAIKMARGRAADRGVAFAVELNGAKGRAITGSKLDLVRALRNLLDNAVEHTATGQAIRVLARADGGATALVVENPGEPIPDEEADNLFAPFFRGAVDQSSNATGAGLGLAIARGIARAHDGDIALDRSFVSGARFVLTLPCDRRPDA